MVKYKLGKVKTLDREFPVAFSAKTLTIYKKAFKADLLADLDEYSDQSQVDFTGAEYRVKAMQIVWAFAKTANKKVRKPNIWIKQFIGHNPHDIFTQTTELLLKGVK